jgi:hypothetical protein
VAWFAVGVAAVLGAVAVAYADVLGALWYGAVGLHLEAREAEVRLPRPSILVTVVLVTGGYLGILAVLAAGVSEVPRTLMRGWLAARAELIALVVAGLAFCMLQRPLLHHHLVIVAWPLALLAASSLPRRLRRPRAWGLVALGVALVLPWTVHGRDIMPSSERAQLQAVAAEVAAHTAPSQSVVCDLPVVGLLAGRAAEPATVDPSYVRVQTGALPPSAIEAAAGEAGAACVGRAFRRVPGVRAALDRRFARHVRLGGIEVWTMPRDRTR